MRILTAVSTAAGAPGREATVNDDGLAVTRTRSLTRPVNSTLCPAVRAPRRRGRGARTNTHHVIIPATVTYPGKVVRADQHGGKARIGDSGRTTAERRGEVTDMDERIRHRTDMEYAYSCAVNVQRCSCQPRSEHVFIGNHLEHRVVTRWDALIDRHARLVLVHCRAEPSRLATLQSYFAFRSAADTHIDTPPVQDTYAVAEILAAEALCLVCEAGGLADLRTRSRLLAGVKYQLNRELCADLGTPERSGIATDLIAEFDRIDNQPEEGP